ncbi:MAG: hypothetical protein CVU39_01265 [Chloroflexi bacterium HGW-Chloroflexi-10]|nr:MAG: hypothetical protein CVU39_01265 [Chloroflexi bacterium HGW-Chloroflexi-10]
MLHKSSHWMKIVKLLFGALIVFSLVPTKHVAAELPPYPVTWSDHATLADQFGGSSKGLFVDAAGQYAYFGMGPRLVIADIHTDVGHVVNYWVSEPLHGQIEAIVVRDGYAYIAAHRAGMIIVDVSDPANMHEVGTYYFPNHFFDIILSGDMAILSTESYGVFFVDISDPTNPDDIFNYLNNDLYSFYSLVLDVEDNFLYAAGGEDGLVVFDLNYLNSSPPSIPTPVSVAVAGHFFRSIVKSGNTVYMGDTSGSMTSFNVSNLASITQVTDLDLTPASFYNGIQDIQVSDGTAYLAMGDGTAIYPKGEGGACRIAVSDSGVFSGSPICYTTGIDQQSADEVQLLNGQIYAAFSGGLRILNQTVTEITLSGGLLYDFLPITDVAKVDSLYYITDQANFTIYDSSTVRDTFAGDFRQVRPFTANQMKYAVVQDGDSRIRVLNVNNPDNISQASTITISGNVIDMEMAGTILFLLIDLIPGDNQLVSFDLNNPTVFALKDQDVMTETVKDLELFTWFSFGPGMTLKANRRAYVALYDNGIKVLNVTDPADMTLVEQVNFGGKKVYFLAASNTSQGLLSGSPTELYMCIDSCSTIAVYNPRDFSEGQKGTIDNAGTARDLLVKDDRLYIARIGGVEAYDISADAIAPAKTSEIELPGTMHHIRAGTANQVLTVSNESGVMVVNVQNEKIFLPLLMR